MKVGIVGRGRLGRSLERWLITAGYAVDSRGRDQGWPSGDVVVLTVPDAAIASVAKALPVGPVVLHCSAASSLDVLRPHPKAGSLHPLMTFPGPEIALPPPQGLPAAVDGRGGGLEVATELAHQLGMVPFAVPGDRRLYHAAAVLAGNCATVLLAEAARVLAAAGVAHPPQLLVPLAVQSLRNASSHPAKALTGPLTRNDHAVVAAHQSALQQAGLTDTLALYRLMLQRTQALHSTLKKTTC